MAFEENFYITVSLTAHGASLEISGSKRNENIIIIIIIITGVHFLQTCYYQRKTVDCRYTRMMHIFGRFHPFTVHEGP